ncbi:hypothetical protein [Mycobacterium sp. shizuoka-1]|uniref:hypothetical protein n=1 Tax=Mycobacterium sp. shizuoka-1 TaxID=2039281 RepID=UPI000C06302C|nr:hypothetical protein [Mycobacterium sp. shizuoka-1]GAY14177.1 hypothetical protein MSZK_09030 [Mycobacterium sp. shizuoka-1]
MSAVQHSNGKPIRVSKGNLILICEVCGHPVVNGAGFLTIRERKWLIYHGDCAQTDDVTCGVIPGPNGNRPCRINVSLIATAELLLTTLDLKATNWLQLIQKVVWDSEFYFDPEGLNGGKRTAKQLVEANYAAYQRAGFGTQLNVKAGER